MSHHIEYPKDHWADEQRFDELDYSSGFDPEIALEYVNIIREARGLEPLHAQRLEGVPGDPERCLLARALDCEVLSYEMRFATIAEADLVRDVLGFRSSEEAVQLPPELAILVAAFDEGELGSKDLAPPNRRQLSLADSPIVHADAIAAEAASKAQESTEEYVAH